MNKNIMKRFTALFMALTFILPGSVPVFADEASAKWHIFELREGATKDDSGKNVDGQELSVVRNSGPEEGMSQPVEFNPLGEKADPELGDKGYKTREFEIRFSAQYSQYYALKLYKLKEGEQFEQIEPYPDTGPGNNRNHSIRTNFFSTVISERVERPDLGEDATIHQTMINPESETDYDIRGQFMGYIMLKQEDGSYTAATNVLMIGYDGMLTIPSTAEIIDPEEEPKMPQGKEPINTFTWNGKVDATGYGQVGYPEPDESEDPDAIAKGRYILVAEPLGVEAVAIDQEEESFSADDLNNLLSDDSDATNEEDGVASDGDDNTDNEDDKPEDGTDDHGQEDEEDNEEDGQEDDEEDEDNEQELSGDHNDLENEGTEDTKEDVSLHKSIQSVINTLIGSGKSGVFQYQTVSEKDLDQAKGDPRYMDDGEDDMDIEEDPDETEQSEDDRQEEDGLSDDEEQEEDGELSEDKEQVDFNTSDGGNLTEELMDDEDSMILDTAGVYNVNWAEYYITFMMVYFDYKKPLSQLGEEGVVFVADPINVVNGNFYWKYTDIKIHAKTPLELERYYNSQLEDKGPFGYGWTHSFHYGFYDNGYTVTLQLPDGKTVNFKNDINNEGSYIEPEGSQYHLKKNSDSDYEIHTKDGRTLYFDDSKILRIQKNGLTLYNFDYSGDKLTKVTNKQGAFLTFEYEGEYISQVTDSAGRNVAYTYEGDNLVKYTNPDDDSLSYEYNDPYDEHNVTAVLDFNGNRYIENIYDQNDRAIEQVMLDRTSVYLEYDEENMENIYTDQYGVKTAYSFNDRREVLDIKYEDESEVNNVFLEGQKLSETDREGNNSAYAYDENQNITEITFPDGKKELYTYDEDKQITGITRRDQRTIKYTYDDRGNITEITDGNGSITTYEYDQNDFLVMMINREGEETNYENNSLGLPTKITNPANEITQYTYDEAGRVTSIETPEGIITVYTYTPGGKLLSSVRSGGGEDQTTEYVYNPNGYVIKTTDAMGYITEAVYDGMNAVTEESNKEGSKIYYTYDEMGNVLTSTDYEGNETTYIYDKEGNLSSIKDPRGNTTKYGYNKNGEVTSITDAAGNTRNYTIDSMGRVSVHSDTRGADTTYEYDSMGRVTEIKTGEGNISRYAYDGNGNITEYKDGNSNSTKYAYDKEDRLTEIRDGLGRKTKFKYDKAGRVIETENAMGDLATTKYNKDGMITGRESEIGQVTKYEYDKLGRMIRMEKADGTETLYAYNAGNQMTEMTTVYGTTLYEYNKEGEITKITNPEGGVTSYEYDKNGNQLSIVNALGYKTSYEYDNAGNMIKYRDNEGWETVYEYNSRNLISAVTDGNGNRTSYSYDGEGNLIQVESEGTGTVKLSYDYENNLRKIEDGEGYETTYVYDGAGNRTGKTDGNGNQTEYIYDAANQNTAVINAMGDRYELSYDALGRISEVRDEEGAVTKYSYDGIGRVEKITDALGQSMAYEYDSMNRVTSERDKNGVTRKYEYDKIGNMVKYTDGLGYEYEYEYDKMGRAVKVTEPGPEPSHNVTKYEYDILGQVTAVVDPHTHRKEFTYDGNGRIREVKDEVGNITQYAYDGNGNLSKTRDGAGDEVSYEYDGLNNLTKVTVNRKDSNANIETKEITTYKYDKRGLLSQEISAVGTVKKNEYDGAGNIKVTIDEEGNVISYRADALNRIEAVEYGNETNKVSYVYNKVGEIVEMTDRLGETKFEYDAVYQLKKVTDHNGRETKYEYDKNGTNTSIQYPDGTRGRYAYDAEGRMQWAEDGDGARVTYEYNSIGHLIKKTLPTGEFTEYTNNKLGQVTQAKEIYNYETIRHYEYNYDDAGRLIKEYDTGVGYEPEQHTANYKYDRGDKLTETRDDRYGTRQYQYDTAGNIIRESQDGTITEYRYNNRNQLLSKTTGGKQYTYGYDKRGNLISESLNGKIQKSYTYDAANRLVKGETASGDKSEYWYNGLGMRVGHKETIRGDSPVRNNYGHRSKGYSDGSYHIGNIDDMALRERENLGQQIYEDNYGLSRQNDPIEITKSYIIDYVSEEKRDLMLYEEGSFKVMYYYGLEGKMSQKTAGIEGEINPVTGEMINTAIAGDGKNIQTDIGVEFVSKLYYHNTRQGGTAYVTDEKAVIRAWGDHDEWGRIRFREGNDINIAGLEVTAAYTTYTYDKIMEKHFAMYRFYDSENRRFIAEDPIRSGYNWYAYVDNNPTNWVDPLGLWVDVIEFDFKDGSRESIYIDKNYESILRAYEELITAQKSSKQDLDYENERRDKIQSTIIGGDNDYKELADLLTSEYARQYGNEVSLTEQAFEMCLQHAKTSSQFVENAKSVGEDVLDVVIPIVTFYAIYYLIYTVAGILVNQGSGNTNKYGIDLNNLNYSNTVQNHTNRPYQNSTQIINEIIQSGSPVADQQGTGALSWNVEGTLNGSKGIYELIIDPFTNTVWHFVFKSTK